MSWQPAPEPKAMHSEPDGIEMAIVPRSRDLGEGFLVSRLLPFARRRMVGPFVFFDAMGPTLFEGGRGLDVRPHPHIGLATITYLFEGEIVHRDSLGNIQPIRPGEANWMTAGSGIAHSERSDAATRQKPSRLAGIQSWVALPRAQEETPPGFTHHAKTALPLIEGEGKSVRLIAGSFAGKRSPVELFSPMVYADVVLGPGARLSVPAEHEERAVYLVEGGVEIAGKSHIAGQLLVFRPEAEITLAAPAGARLMLLGGEPMDGPRHIWWNFVSSSKERIEAAKADWKAGRFAAVIGDTDFIPLPD
ncbi:MAG TPA: pirin family protein [Stellaceae bacterium]|nr:pirin family protein [Stellaceae bacterium]